MLRSLYSGISGLKVHQTRMDVIGNNIANVNTIGFKSSTVNFSDILYQTTQNATGANEANGKAGTNAMQIGLGSTVSSIKSTMSTQGGSQRTDNALDLMINGTAFFVVNKGGENYFTKNGSFTVDGEGNLATESGAMVMGWQTDANNPNNVVQDAVSSIKVYSIENMFTPPEATTDTYFEGNIDPTDEDLTDGKTVQMEFYDSLGNKYTAKYKITSQDVVDDNIYDVNLTDILDSGGQSIYVESTTVAGSTTYTAKVPEPVISFGGNAIALDTVDPLTGDVTLTGTSPELTFNASTGKFVSVGNAPDLGDSVVLSVATGNTGATSSETVFRDISVNFSTLTMYENNGNSSITSSRGSLADGTGAGMTIGTMTGVSISTDGKIYASYDNGNSKLLGQVAVADFSNPSGLESVGNSMYRASQNSGDFDGIGKDITSIGLSFSTGVLEMSNVDLASEFTNMITTQRGFQANSKIITTSDSLLEELISLKR